MIMLETDSLLGQAIKLTAVVIVTSVVLIAIMVCLPVTLLIVTTSNDTSAYPPGEDQTHFDPIAAAEEVQAFVGENVQLVSMTSSYVHADGTQNLTAQGVYATTRYIFVPIVPAPTQLSSAKTGFPIGKHYYQGIEVTVGRAARGMTKNGYILKNIPTTPVSLPTCQLATLYDQLIIEGKPWTGSVGVEYNKDGYVLRLYSLNPEDIYVRFSHACEKIEEWSK